MVLRRWLILTGLGIALAGAGPSGYIAAKAWLAQGLIESAWNETLKSGEKVLPWPWADTYPVARLRVPRLDVDQLVLAGMSGRSIAFAPGLAMAGAKPGKAGTILISGHRDTHLAFLAQVRDGDWIELEDDAGRWHRYQVVAQRVMDGESPVLLDPTEGALLLATCYPFDGITGNATQRYLVTARPVTPFRNPA